MAKRKKNICGTKTIWSNKDEMQGVIQVAKGGLQGSDSEKEGKYIKV